jgi:hypothetical protein
MIRRNSVHTKNMVLSNNKNQVNNLLDVLIIDAVATSIENTNQRACIYKVKELCFSQNTKLNDIKFFKTLLKKYVVEKPEEDEENLSIFRKYCSWNPCLFYFIVNFVALLLLVAIGFGVCIGISSTC